MNFLGAMYSAVLFLGATNASAVQAVVAIERTVFYREKAAGMYSALPYALAQVTKPESYTKFLMFFLLVPNDLNLLLFNSTGGYRIDLYCDSDIGLRCYPLFHDRIWVGDWEIRIFLLLHNGLLHLLCDVWNDARLTYTRSWSCRNFDGLLSQLVEFICRFFDSSTGMLSTTQNKPYFSPLTKFVYRVVLSIFNNLNF